jgi:hypothetical protein
MAKRGIHIHLHVHADTATMEALMTIAEDLNTLAATVAEFVEDVNARVAALETAQGNFTPEGQVAFDALRAAVDGGVAAVGDADGDGNPAPAVPAEPVA